MLLIAFLLSWVPSVGAIAGVVDLLVTLVAAGALIANSYENGGGFAIDHYAARILLWRWRVAPLLYVRFLNEAVDRLFPSAPRRKL